MAATVHPSQQAIRPKNFLTVHELDASGWASFSAAARVLGFSCQAYYKWRAQPQSERESQEEVLLEEIGRIHRDDPEFGYRFIADELHAKGVRVSERKVWKLCSQVGIFSRFCAPSRRRKKAGPAVGGDLLQRHFHAQCPNVAWVVSITEHWTDSGKVYVRALNDLCSRRIVGWAVDGRMTSRLAVKALDDAMRKRHYPQEVIVHSDRGGQFGSRRFQAALKAYGARGAMGGVGACGDNARWSHS